MKNSPLVFFILFTTVLVGSLEYINITRIEKLYLSDIDKKVSVMVNKKINNISNDIELSDFNYKDVYILSKDDNNGVRIDYNTVLVNKLMNEIISDYRKRLDISVIDPYINIIVMPNKAINFSYYNIPAKIDEFSDIYGSISFDAESYGINTVLVKLSININVIVSVIGPFGISEVVNYQNDFLVSAQVMEGHVSNYNAKLVY